MAINNHRLIGLTGGIGTGKTTVSNYLANSYKLPIFDADLYAREAVQPGSSILNNIAERYGADILAASGALNRQQLGNIIFNNPQEKYWLEQQIHPYVRDRFVDAIDKLPLNSTAVLVIPLLFEANMTDLVTEIWVVFVDEQQQLNRLIERDGLTLAQAKARINSQMPLQEKCNKADVILNNSSTLEALLKQVDAALKDFRLQISN
ncbi:dephospho-CoA kinase [Aerosakkonema sp. BLCC-F183]|uniref:dephospho-CoA kinase n=1 Tax=Aerosakkonema sp. BLCC-F183 TaxID=3342834 RepID=UPI0035B78CE3